MQCKFTEHLMTEQTLLNNFLSQQIHKVSNTFYILTAEVPGEKCDLNLQTLLAAHLEVLLAMTPLMLYHVSKIQVYAIKLTTCHKENKKLNKLINKQKILAQLQG